MRHQITVPFQEIELGKISIWKLNPRKIFNEESLQDLAQSIREHGIVQPIVVRPVSDNNSGGSDNNIEDIDNKDAEYVIVAGERRYRAALNAGLKTVPAIIKEITREQALEIATIENLQREDISAIEEAQAYRTYLDATKVTQTELAQKLGVSQSHIANRLRLLKLPDEVQDQIISGEITATEGRELATVADIPEVVEEALTNRESGWTMTKSIAVAKNQYDRKRQEAEELEMLRIKFAKQIGDRVTELQNQGYTVVQGATNPNTDGFESHYMWNSYKRCEGCTKAIMVVDVWYTSWSPAHVKTTCYCPDKKCLNEVSKDYNGQRRHPLTAEEKRKKELRKAENDRRGEKLALFLVQTAAVNAELEHPEARLVAEFIFFGFYNNDKRLEEVCKHMGWKIEGGAEAAIRAHLTNDRPKIILKAAAILIAVCLEEQLKRSDEPIKNQYVGKEMQCYFNWLAGRGYIVPTELSAEQPRPGQIPAKAIPLAGIFAKYDDFADLQRDLLEIKRDNPSQWELAYPLTQFEIFKGIDEPIQKLWELARGYFEVIEPKADESKKTDVDHCREFNKCEESCEEKCGV